MDAQGLGFIQPVTWIGEWLFGWTRSSKRGTSVWSGVEDPSRASTPAPDEADDEDIGDYDNVTGKRRSRQNSQPSNDTDGAHHWLLTQQ